MRKLREESGEMAFDAQEVGRLEESTRFATGPSKASSTVCQKMDDQSGSSASSENGMIREEVQRKKQDMLWSNTRGGRERTLLED